MGNAPTRWFELLAGLVLLAVSGFFALRWGLEGAVHNRKIQIVPDMKGRSIAAALDMLAPVGLALRKEGQEFNGSVPIGAVLRQNPAAGTKVREGKVVRVVLSDGGETVFVPSLVGLPLRNAEMLLRQSQLLLGSVNESYSLRMEKGMVLTQEPRAESSVERSAMVNVAISGGPPPSGIILMPDFVRKNVAEGTAWAAGAGIELAVAKDASSLFPYGVILSQDPAPDAVLPPGGKVKLTISGNTKPAPGQTATRTLHYAVPQGSSESHVRIVLMDQYGEREIFNGLRAPGSRVDVDMPVAESGQARTRVFLNGVLVEERDW